MIRRHLVSALAVLAMGLVVAAPAHAGGASTGAAGVKKNAYLRIANNTATPYYVTAVPSTLQPPTTAAQAKLLGAYLVNPGKSVLYPVPAGSGNIAALAANKVPADPNALLPLPDAVAPYTVSRGKTRNASIKAGPAITVQ